MRASHALVLPLFVLLALAAGAPLLADTPSFVLDDDGRWLLPLGALSLRADAAGVSVLTARGFAPTFQLDALGRDGALVPLSAASPQLTGGGFVVDREPLALTFAPGPGGASVVLTVADPGLEREGALALRLRILGAHLPRVDGRGRVAAIYGASAHDILHARLAGVSDATGRPLAARWESDESGLLIVIDDSGALYPIRAQAALSAASWVADGGQADAFLGVSVAGLGDTDKDGYGDVVVGAYQWESSASQAEEGRALAFVGSPSGLATTPSWSPEGDQPGAFFGRRVAAAGDVNGDGYRDLLVSATHWDGAQENVGRIEVYHGGSTGLEATPAWSYSGDQAGAYCGIAVAGAGDVQKDGYDDVLVGCANYDSAGNDAGRVLLFHGSASGLSGTAAWSFDGSHAGELLGISLAGGADVDGDTYPDVAVGAPGFAEGQVNEGRALVFLGGSGGLAALPAWEDSSDQAGALFGQSVALLPDADGDGHADLLVGAQTYRDQFPDEGGAFLYLGTSGGLSASPDWSLFGGQEGARLGYAIASVGDVNEDGLADALLGAFLYDGDLVDEGRMSLFLGSPAGLRPEASFEVEGDGLDARLGISVASAGDVNGDGTLDVIAGAHFHTQTHSREGRAVVFHGPLIDPPPQLGSTLRVRRAGDDIVLDWSPPASGSGEGPVTFYRVRSDVLPNGSFPVVAETYLPGWTDADAASGGASFHGYLVSAENSGAGLL